MQFYYVALRYEVDTFQSMGRRFHHRYNFALLIHSCLKRLIQSTGNVSPTDSLPSEPEAFPIISHIFRCRLSLHSCHPWMLSAAQGQ